MRYRDWRAYYMKFKPKDENLLKILDEWGKEREFLHDTIKNIKSVLNSLEARLRNM